MKLKPLTLATTLALASTTATAAPWVNIDARSGGMGGLSIVTANIDAAPFSNPAMLAAGQEDDDFGMLVTGGGYIGDPNDFSGSLETFITSFNTKCFSLSAHARKLVQTYMRYLVVYR